MKKNHYVSILLLIILASCQSKQEPATVNKSKAIANFPKVNLSTAYIGSYMGVLPCADCEGMETIITINENNTYTKSVHYLGKGSKVFEQKGSFSWNSLGNVLKLNDIENAPNQYLVIKGKMIQLDLDGTIIEGNLEKQYELSKQPEIVSQLEIVSSDNDKINLNNKLEASASLEQVNPAEGKFTLAETKWKLIELNGITIKQKGIKPNILKMNTSDGKFWAYAGCNNMFGTYAMPKTNTISFSEIASTRMACPNMVTENELMRTLEETTKYVLDKETLTFYGSGKIPTATFVALN
ncbi:copper resistance protein NlpE N-terminal domain-containing protein [Flavobacterium sp.]